MRHPACDEQQKPSSEHHQGAMKPSVSKAASRKALEAAKTNMVLADGGGQARKLLAAPLCHPLLIHDLWRLSSGPPALLP